MDNEYSGIAEMRRINLNHIYYSSMFMIYQTVWELMMRQCHMCSTVPLKLATQIPFVQHIPITFL